MGRGAAILAAPWSDDGSGYKTPSRHVKLQVTNISREAPAGDEQQVTVSVIDPQSTQVLFEASALKVRALAGEKVMDGGVTSDIDVGCAVP